jgi:iron(II)-dependent oxidoreductase
MACTLPQQIAAPQPTPAETLATLEQARRETLALLAHLDDRELERTLSPIMSPLAWDLAHIAAYEDLWLAHRHAGLELLRPDLAELYDAFETPRSMRGEIQLLSAPHARAYMEEVRERVAEATAREGVGDGVLHELVLRHELQHTETMRQTMAIAGLLPPGEPRLRPLAGEEGWLELPPGTFMMGAGSEGFAYDNERPRHPVATPAFRIARRPVSNASWLRFSEGGGYERREWWSQEGWAWKEEHDITHHPAAADGRRGELEWAGGAGAGGAGAGGAGAGGAGAGGAGAGGAGAGGVPICHVSWYEADAFARAHHARLPTEAEWERATTWGQPQPDGSGDLPGNGRARETIGGEDRGSGALQGVGQVWEWTASSFRGYPGFVAHPYREYSEVFFGEDYRVLRGGSWATSPRVASPTFRNWDLPQRRQIFAGLRLARDVA